MNAPESEAVATWLSEGRERGDAEVKNDFRMRFTCAFPLLLACVVLASTRGAMDCEDIHIPTLTSHADKVKVARTCRKTGVTGPLPLMVWAHGDLGGGPLLKAYETMLEDVIGSDFVVATYESCWVDAACEAKG